MEDLGGSTDANEILKDNGVVIYYSETCPHCISKQKLWNVLSKELKKQGIKSGKLESKNQSPEDGIAGFPTYKVGPSKLEKSSDAEVSGDVKLLMKDLLGQRTGGRRSRRHTNRRRKSHRTLRRYKSFR
jgi:hypothetical protein